VQGAGGGADGPSRERGRRSRSEGLGDAGETAVVLGEGDWWSASGSDHRLRLVWNGCLHEPAAGVFQGRHVQGLGCIIHS
jgi:hypothetical protein